MRDRDPNKIAEHEIARHRATLEGRERYSSEVDPGHTIEFYMNPEMLFYRFDDKKAVVDGDTEVLNKTYADNASAVMDREFNYDDFSWAYGLEDSGDICGAVAAFDEKDSPDFGIINKLLGKDEERPTVVHIFDSREQSERVDIHIDRNKPDTLREFLSELGL